MLANLLLLPSLLLSLERNIANQQTLRQPAFQIIPDGQVTEESELLDEATEESEEEPEKATLEG
jgi:hypothetical protein